MSSINCQFWVHWTSSGRSRPTKGLLQCSGIPSQSCGEKNRGADGRSSGSDWGRRYRFHICLAYFSGLNFREYTPENMALYGTVPPFLGSWNFQWQGRMDVAVRQKLFEDMFEGTKHHGNKECGETCLFIFHQSSTFLEYSGWWFGTMDFYDFP